MVMSEWVGMDGGNGLSGVEDAFRSSEVGTLET
jgi:hypothetical protein